MCQSRCDNSTIIKYADDSVIVSLLSDGESSHGSVIEDFVHWCNKSYLQLNTTKTKDMLIDFRRKPHRHEVTLIKGQTIEYVQTYKYLGTIIDSKLSFEENCEMVCKKGQQRLHCLRKLAYFHIDRTLMNMFYRAFIESILSFSLVSWFGQITLRQRKSLEQVIKWSSRLLGESQLSLAALYSRQVQRVVTSILNDDSHPLHCHFRLLPSGRRFVVPRCKTQRYRNSFVPAAVIELNRL